METISTEEFQSISSLGYMFLRMGRNDEAEKSFLALLVLADTMKQKIWLYKNLALVYTRKKEYKTALEYIRNAISERTLKSDEAYFYLLRAECLWQSSRHEESKAAIKQYYNLIAR